MKCEACKYWRELTEAAPRFEDDVKAGECRRHAPRPGFDAALVLLTRLRNEASIAPDSASDPCSYDLMATWPVTWSDAFCGDFHVKREPVF